MHGFTDSMRRRKHNDHQRKKEPVTKSSARKLLVIPATAGAAFDLSKRRTLALTLLLELDTLDTFTISPCALSDTHV